MILSKYSKILECLAKEPLGLNLMGVEKRTRIAHKILTRYLKELQMEGLVTKREYGLEPKFQSKFFGKKRMVKGIYHITKKGLRVLKALSTKEAGDQSPILYLHDDVKRVQRLLEGS